jgi:hypothetical protein
MDELERLIAEMRDDALSNWQGLQSGMLSVDEWQEQQARSLLAFHYAAYLIGRDSNELSPRERAVLSKQVGKQIDYLNKFADVIDAEWQGDTLKPAWQQRLLMYTRAITATYWQGATFGIPLPAYPCDGSSECLTNCGCSWRLVELDREAGDIDAYWIRGKNDSCETCRSRERNWAPLRIRGGQVMRQIV